MCNAAACTQGAATACTPRAVPRHQQHQQHARASRKAALVARCTAAAAATPAAAPSSLTAHPLLLERGCATSSLSRDKLSQQEQEMLIGMGSAIRALQEVWPQPSIGAASRWRNPAPPSPWPLAPSPSPQDLPSILDRQPHLEPFSQAIVFEDRLSPRLGLPAASCAGREAYARLMWSLRFHRTLFFSKAKVRCTCCACCACCALGSGSPRRWEGPAAACRHAAGLSLCLRHSCYSPAAHPARPSAAPLQVELQRMWERERGVVCVRWSARAAPRLLDGLGPRADATHMSLDGVSGEQPGGRPTSGGRSFACQTHTQGQILGGLPEATA